MTQIEDTSGVNSMAGSDISKLLQDSFLTAYIVTRSELVAERLVCLAIERMEPARVHSSTLVAETLRLSAEFIRDRRDPSRFGSIRIDLGDQLTALMELEPAVRYSYVARVLLGYPLADCVELLQTDAVKITRNLLVATRFLCERERERRSVSQFAAFVNAATEAIATSANRNQDAPELGVDELMISHSAEKMRVRSIEFPCNKSEKRFSARFELTSTTVS